MESPLPPDPYAALGVLKSADSNTIKSTYRKLALKYHPDKVTDESKKAEATEKFHSIQQAYDIVGDDDKRARYDAQVRLAELRRQNLELRGQGGVRVDVRTAGYDIRTAAPPYASFTARGPSRVYPEERRPNYYDGDETLRASSRKYDFAYVKRSPKEEKETRERINLKEQEKKRAERRREREADVRGSRDRKYASYVDEEIARFVENERRQREQAEEALRNEAETPRRPPLRREAIYEEDRKAADARRYMAESYSSRDIPRPGMYRRTSTRDSPTSAYAYAQARRTTSSTAEKDYFTARPSPSREPSPPRATPKRSAEDVETQPRRPPVLQTQNSAPPKVPITPHDAKEPRKAPPHPPHRAYTTQTDFDRRKDGDENEPPHVHLPRPNTFHEFPPVTPQSTRKTEARQPYSAPPRRASDTTTQTESTYPSGATADNIYAQYPPPPPPPTQTTTTTYVYPKDASSAAGTPKVETGNKFDKYATPATSYRVEERVPGSSSRRGGASSPPRDRDRDAKPSSTAQKMAHLGVASSRAHVSGSRSSPYAYPETASARPAMVPQSSSTRSVPRVSRSPERVSSSERIRDRERRYERERERGREYERDGEREKDRYRDDRRREKLYGEMGPGYIRSTQATSGSTGFVGDDGVTYSRRVRPEDVVYSSGGAGGGSRERVYTGERRPSAPTFSRSTTMPVYAN